MIEDGKIKAVEKGAGGKGDKTIDVIGMTVCPGLIDSTRTPSSAIYPQAEPARLHRKQSHGGVTSMISAGEVHLPGRPKDRSGTKAWPCSPTNRTRR